MLLAGVEKAAPNVVDIGRLAANVYSRVFPSVFTAANEGGGDGSGDGAVPSMEELLQEMKQGNDMFADIEATFQPQRE